MDGITEWIVETFGAAIPAEWIIFAVSLLPLLELRAGILAATLLQVDMIPAFFICAVGTLLPIPLILLLVRQVFDWMRNTCLKGFVQRMEKKVEKNRKKVERYQKWGLFLFVGIPLPGTGAWTGALIAAMMNMRFKDAMPPIIFGTLAADGIMCLLGYGLLGAVL